MKRSVNFSRTRKSRNVTNDIAAFLGDIGYTSAMLREEQEKQMPTQPQRPPVISTTLTVDEIVALLADEYRAVMTAYPETSQATAIEQAASNLADKLTPQKSIATSEDTEEIETMHLLGYGWVPVPAKGK